MQGKKDRQIIKPHPIHKKPPFGEVPCPRICTTRLATPIELARLDTLLGPPKEYAKRKPREHN